MLNRITQLLAVTVCAMLLAPNRSPAVEFMSTDEIRVGMKGIGKSVFKGTKIEEFSIEVLGVLRKAYAGHDMILVKCSGANLEHSGVIAGMSGSPIYINGKLIGALSMTFGYQKDPIAQITPIAPMLDIMRRTDRLDMGMANDQAPMTEVWKSHSSIFTLQSSLFNRSAPLATPGPLNPSSIRPIPCPLTVSGLTPQLCAEFAPRFERYGLRLVAGSGEARDTAISPQDLQPGAAVGVSLIRGDMSASGIGTLTWRDGDRIVGFGHPMFFAGAINMPMTGGVIHTILASNELSFKIFSPSVPLGAVTQDRAHGIAGTIGPHVPMSPVRVTVRSDAGSSHYRYEVLNLRTITADLVAMAVNNALISREQSGADLSIRADLAFKLRGYPVIRSRRWFSGPGTFRDLRDGVGAPLEYLLNNEFERVEVESVDVQLAVEPGIHLLSITRAVADRERARPGDTVRLAVTLEPWRGKPQTRELEFVVPDETPAGELSVMVTTPDSALMLALELAGEKIIPRSVRQAIRFIEQIGPENQLMVQGYVRKKGMVLGGERLPNLPPSMLAAFSGARMAGTVGELPACLLFEQRITLDQVVAGARVISIAIER